MWTKRTTDVSESVRYVVSAQFVEMQGQDGYYLITLNCDHVVRRVGKELAYTMTCEKCAVTLRDDDIPF